MAIGGLDTIDKLLIVSDAWRPQINGVVRTIEWMCKEAPGFNVDIEVLGPSRFRTIPCPTYPEIRLAIASRKRIEREIIKARPTAIHISTEGPLGLAARRFCIKRGYKFSTSYHTRFPEYLRARVPVPESWSYAWLRRFHNASSALMVATQSLEDELDARGFKNLVRWSRGVDLSQFHPRTDVALPHEGPVFLYVGRVSVEKNLEAFLDLDLPGTKMVVGGGPALEGLKATYKDVVFTGPKVGEELARLYAGADVFVFPSLTDTFGIVLIEALASGLPVAAFPVTGPADIITDSRVGVLDNDLRSAALAALTLQREDCAAFAQNYTWTKSAEAFFANALPLHGDVRRERQEDGDNDLPRSMAAE